MESVIAYCIAVASTVAFLVIWFLNAYQVMLKKRLDVSHAEEQVHLHRDGLLKVLGSPDERAARHMLDTSMHIYEQIRKSYEETRKRPLCRCVGVIMGFPDCSFHHFVSTDKERSR